MQKELLRIRVRDTEAATIEIVPSEGGGVEIVVLKKEESTKETTEKKFNGGKDYHCRKSAKADNLEELRGFCSSKKAEYAGNATMKKELKAFWDWYSPRMEDWKGQVATGKLWNAWISKSNNPLVNKEAEDE